MPPAIPFTTKPALAEEMRTALVEARSLRRRWVVADEAFGDNPGLLDGVAGLGLWYFAEVPHTPRVWGEHQATHVPPWCGRGRRPQRERLVEDAPEARTRQTIKEGSQGPIVAEFAAAMRVVAVRRHLARS